MSFTQRRRVQRESQNTDNRHTFLWEEGQCPMLHGGFKEPCSQNPNRSVLFVSLWFAQGEYQAKILDRENHEKCFLTVGTLEHAFTTIEAALKDNTLSWLPDTQSKRNNGY